MGLATCQVQRLPFKPFLVKLGLVKNMPEPLRNTATCDGAAATPPVKTSRGERKPTLRVPALKCPVASTLL
ncbi:hypothetical protein ACRRTK_006296 [Alexandromys fortis]